MDHRGYEMALAEADARLKAVTDRLTRERDEAHGVAQALERQVLSQQEACAKASLAVAELTRERDEALAEVTRRDAAVDRLVAELSESKGERDRLRAALERIAGGRYAGASYIAITALEGRDATG